MAATSEPHVFFHFDPECPWTWLTSRWLTDVAARKGLTIGWRALSLKVLNGDDTPEDEREVLEATFNALRLVEALAAAGDHAAAGRFYTALGEMIHCAKETPNLAVLEKAAAQAGIDDAAALDNRAWDDAVIGATNQAVAAAGGDVGSPVLRWERPDRAVSGPVLSPVPTGDDALRLWEAVEALSTLPDVYEIKRGRPAQPQTFPA